MKKFFTTIGDFVLGLFSKKVEVAQVTSETAEVATSVEPKVEKVKKTNTFFTGIGDLMVGLWDGFLQPLLLALWNGGVWVFNILYRKVKEMVQTKEGCIVLVVIASIIALGIVTTMILGAIVGFLYATWAENYKVKKEPKVILTEPKPAEPVQPSKAVMVIR